MTIDYSTTRDILDSIIEDEDLLSLTTSSAGSSDKNTLVDATLNRYKDGYFVGHYVWLVSAEEERMVKQFARLSGTIQFYEAATAQVGASASYKLWKYSNNMKLAQINRALRYAFPRFFNPVKNETLFGQNSYGEEPEEYNRYMYTIPSGFDGYPDQIWLKPAYIGTHTGSDDASVLTDTSASWKISELVGLTLYNKTDGSSGTVTANTSTTVTATLSGGTDDDWDTDDEYIVQNLSIEPTLLTTYKILDPVGSTKRFYADISEDYLITLIGKGRLTEFTTEDSETELTEEQAEIVCQKAAANIYRKMAAKVDTKNRDRFVSLSLEAEALYEGKSRGDAMKTTSKYAVDYTWLHGVED